MGDKTSYDAELPRNDAATRIQDLARQLEGEGIAEVQVGNKTVTLSPASNVEYAIEVEERSPMLGGRREEISIELEWTLEKEEG